MPKATNPAWLLATGLALTIGHAHTFAQADEARNTIKIGYAPILYNTDSGELTGPTGTTPPGVTADLKDTRTLALIYQRRISGPWSVLVQGGTPPIVKFDGAGSAAAVGRVGTARAWFPAVLAAYSFGGLAGFEPYVGAGLNYTWFTDRHVTAAYTAAFGGTSSTAKLKDSLGPVVKLGVEIPLARSWVLDLAYARYWIKTTATIATDTPGVGLVERRIAIKANPDVFALTVGYRF
jgi:outer membrane protein